MPSSQHKQRHVEFLQLAGHSAVDFANTRVPPPGLDLEFLQKWRDVIDWLEQARLSTPAALHVPAPRQERALKTLKELRDAWRNQLARIVAGAEVSEDFLETINGHLSEDSFTETLRRDGEGGLRLVRSVSELRGEKLALALVAQLIGRFLAEANPAYVRHCANTASCSLYFYDTTKNHHRQWCSVAACGNRHKVAEFRKRRAMGKARGSR